VLTANEVVGDLALFGGERASLPVAVREAVRMLAPRGASDRIRGQVIYQGPLIAPIAKGAEVGKLRIMRGETRALEVPVFAAEDAPAGSMQRRAADAALEVSTGWFRRLMSRGGPS
jgi:D-alanyl-D-alanine carboxypeptidase (penicillin-binding protein 5/6)